MALVHVPGAGDAAGCVVGPGLGPGVGEAPDGPVAIEGPGVVGDGATEGAEGVPEGTVLPPAGADVAIVACDGIGGSAPHAARIKLSRTQSAARLPFIPNAPM
jgi:hypothetical protein